MDQMSDLKAAQDVHHRLEFYLVAVAFTIAGFAIQTGKFTGNWLGDMAEVASWIFIATSGVIGLWRLEYIPVMYRVGHNLDRLDADATAYSGHTEYTDTVQKIQDKVREHRPKLAAMESSNHRRYFWQKLLFVLGLLLLMTARFIEQADGWYW